jgi:tetratricopeptide (TPR) repeat protein
MSLLMDALKRAETSKQEAARALAGGEAKTTFAEKLILEPLPTGRPKGQINPLPDLATHIEAVDADLATANAARPQAPAAARANPTPPPVSAKPSIPNEREAIRNAFAAKLAAKPIPKWPLWTALGALLIGAVVIGAYVWYQLNSMGNNTLAPPTQARPASPTTGPTTSPPLPALPLEPPAIFVPSSQSTAAGNATADEKPIFSPPRPAYRPASNAVPTEAALEAGANVPIRLTRTRPEPDANLLRGHGHVESNELDLARRDFEQALRRDPNNTDALLALAAIAQRQGRVADAEYLHRRAMVANPGDPAVQAAAMGGTAASADPETTESRLKTMLAAQPESAPLNFTLGNLYARQARWSEAQQVYFNAVAAEADHPDYLFNLAVSLDHLRQSRPAAQHYQLALEAANKRPAAFDRAQVKKRLAELQPEPR